MRVRRSLLNFGTMVLYTGVTTMVALWSTPLLLGWLGEERFGAYRVVNDAYGYLTLLELGLGGALGPLLARALGERDHRALGATVATGVRGYLRVSAWTLAIGVLLTPVVPWLARGLTGPLLVDFRRAWLVGLLAFTSLCVLPMRSVFEARQLGYVINLLLTAQSLVITGTALALARAGWGITGQAVALVVGTWTFSAAVVLGAVWAYPKLLRDALAAPPDPEARSAVRSLSLPTLMISLSGRIGLLTDNLVVGSVLGPARVNSLYNSQRLAVLGQTILQGVGGAAWAALAELHAQGLRETFNRRLIELSRLVAVLSVVGLAPVVAYNRSFIRLWLGLDGPEFTYAGDVVVAVAALNVFLLGQLSLWSWCFSATGRIARVVPQAVAASVLNLAASVLLTSRFGLVGPLLGTSVALITINLWLLPLQLRRDFGTPLGPLGRAVAGPFLAGLLASMALGWLARTHEPRTWLALAVSMGLAALGLLAACLTVLLPQDERKLWHVRLRGLLPTRVCFGVRDRETVSETTKVSA